MSQEHVDYTVYEGAVSFPGFHVPENHENDKLRGLPGDRQTHKTNKRSIL